MLWPLLGICDAALLWHLWVSLPFLFVGKVCLHCCNGCVHRVYQGIGKCVEATLTHHLVEHFQSSEEDTQGATRSCGDGNVLPALMVRLHLALKFTYQVVIDGVSYLVRRSIPSVARSLLPDIGIKPTKKGENGVQVGLNCLGINPYTCLFRKSRQGHMELIRSIKNKKWMLVLDRFGSRRKPILGHFL